jgi:hypothetical protein
MTLLIGLAYSLEVIPLQKRFGVVVVVVVI